MHFPPARPTHVVGTDPKNFSHSAINAKCGVRGPMLPTRAAGGACLDGVLEENLVAGVGDFPWPASHLNN